MGRLKKYTDEEKQAIKKQRAYDYYWKNKDKQDARARQKYKDSKNILPS
jgi:hypothetical protein